MNEGDIEQVASVTRSTKVNPKNWDAFLASQSESTNIEDRRTAADKRFQDLDTQRVNYLRKIGEANPDAVMQGDFTNAEFKEYKDLAKLQRTKQLDLAEESLVAKSVIETKLKKEEAKTRGHPLPKPRY
jgi:hypothetical protein